MNKVTIASASKAAAIYIDPKGQDYNGLRLVANSFAEDINLVAGVIPAVETTVNELKETVIIAGSIGNNDIIDSLISKGTIDVTNIKDKRECYKIQVVEKPIEGVDNAIVIVGSDKRGTIYGIYHISELIGVSPWVYFADIMPQRKSGIILSEEELNTTSKEPSV